MMLSYKAFEYDPHINILYSKKSGLRVFRDLPYPLLKFNIRGKTETITFKLFATNRHNSGEIKEWLYKSSYDSTVTSKMDLDLKQRTTLQSLVVRISND